jgi:hypothetical protein
MSMVKLVTVLFLTSGRGFYCPFHCDIIRLSFCIDLYMRSAFQMKPDFPPL